jgi:predicted alpha/beta hydrolase family esterase
MSKQVVVIHGGKTFKTYQDYIESLKKREVTIDKFKAKKDWRYSLQDQLGPDFEVFAPMMPNGFNAVYQEWRIWLERMVPFLHDDLVLVGHSLGGIFLAKYLSENVFPKKIASVILISAPFDADLDEERSLCSFSLPPSLEKLSEQVKNIHLIQSKDDPIVPFEQVHKYQTALPNSKLIMFEDRQHFNQESFPELVELIISSY